MLFMIKVKLNNLDSQNIIMNTKRKYEKAIPIIQAIIVTVLFHVAFFVLFSPTGQAATKKTDNQHRFVMSLNINKLPAREQVLLKKFLYYNNPLDMLHNANSVLKETQILTNKYDEPEDYNFKEIVVNDSYNFQKFIPFNTSKKDFKLANNKILSSKKTFLSSLISNNYKSNGIITAEKKRSKSFISDINGNKVLNDNKIAESVISLIKKNHVASSLYPTKIAIKLTSKSLQPQVKILTKCGKNDLDIAAFKIATANASNILETKQQKKLILIFNWNSLIKEVAK